MKKITLLLIIITTTIFTTQAGLKRVGFNGPQITGLDYTSVQAAHNDAGTLAGDTIQVYPGALANSFIQTKRFHEIAIQYSDASCSFNFELSVEDIIPSWRC